MTTTFYVDGHEIRSASQRRYIVVGVTQTGAFQVWDGRAGGYVTREVDARSWIIGRSDSLGTAQARARKVGRITGGRVAIVDSTTGIEVV